KLTFTGSGPLKVALRVPSWATSGFTLMVNGAMQSVKAAPGSYAVLDRSWASGDVLEIAMPFTFRIEKTPDDNTLGGIFYGPTILVANSTKTSTIQLTLDQADPGAAFTKASMPLTFTSNGMTF